MTETKIIKKLTLIGQIITKFSVLLKRIISAGHILRVRMAFCIYPLSENKVVEL